MPTQSASQHQTLFSDELEKWLSSSKPKTIASLQTVFVERSFAILTLLLMILPATPLPTGGITHVFEIITVFVAAGMVIGFKKVWVPKRWQHAQLSPALVNKALPLIMRRIRWFELHSSRRWSHIFGNSLTTRFVGIAIALFTITAFLSPPFTGLDTLPSLGVVMLSLALLLEDVIFLITGLLVGIGGMALVIGLGGAIVTAINHLW